MCRFTAFPFGGYGKVVLHPIGGKGAVDVDLTHPEQLTRLQRCWRKSPGWMEGVNWETLVTVELAPFLHPTY